MEAILQSPQFLYRTELSTQAAEDDVIALDDYDVASRLSYFIFNSMPDRTLFDAAAASDLHTIAAVSEQVTRMLEDPRALDQFVSFHEQAWSFNRYNNIAPDPNKFPDVPADLNERLLTASQYFLSDVIAEGGGVQDFLTAPFAYADQAIAPLFGTQVEDGFQRIELDPNERLGLLAQPGFLASHAYAQKRTPFTAVCSSSANCCVAALESLQRGPAWHNCRRAPRPRPRAKKSNCSRLQSRVRRVTCSSTQWVLRSKVSTRSVKCGRTKMASLSTQPARSPWMAQNSKSTAPST